MRLGLAAALTSVAAIACAPQPPESRSTATPSVTPAATPRPTAEPGPTPAPAFRSSVAELSPHLRARMTGTSWRPGCPVALDDLRYVRLSFWDPGGAAREGELVVHADAAQDAVEAFRRLFDARYPITRMRLIDAYEGDDRRSMEDDNTSAFNCRPVLGTSRWSEHAYGRAIDVNPFENPWVKDGEVDPPGAKAFADRARRHPAMIRHGDAVWRAFQAVGWEWGGDWTSPKDYQHFSASGR